MRRVYSEKRTMAVAASQLVRLKLVQQVAKYP